MVPSPSSTTRCDSPSLKIALALALLRSKKFHRPPSSSPATSEADADSWKRKSKERKREILRLKEELKQLEDGARADAELPVASCRCHFFDGIGELGGEAGRSGNGEHWIDEVLRRRFLRLVRWNERKRKVERPVHRTHLLEFCSEDEVERLSTSVDFLVELANNIVEKGEVVASFATFSHQATNFISASLKILVSSNKEIELVEEIVNRMITRLTKKMCSIPENTGNLHGAACCGSEIGFSIQHLIRRLGNEPFIGQRILLLISQRITVTAESLLFLDPFDESFPSIHDAMFLMIQLIELVIADYMRNWTSAEDFDTRLFEEWIRSFLQARKTSELLESKNGLYCLYVERVIGELAKLLAPLARQNKIGPDIISGIFLAESTHSLSYPFPQALPLPPSSLPPPSSPLCSTEPLASAAASSLPLPSWRAPQKLASSRPPPPLGKSSNTTPLLPFLSRPTPSWVSSSSRRSIPFPVGSEPPESDDESFTLLAFSQISPLRSPFWFDARVDDSGQEDAIFGHFRGDSGFPWLTPGLTLDSPKEALEKAFRQEELAWFPPNYGLNLPAANGTRSLGNRGNVVDRKKYNALRRRQIKAETEAWERAAQEYKELEREMLEKKLAPSLPYVKSLFLGWFEPLKDAIEKEQLLQKGKRQKAAYAAHIGLLPADKIAIIVMHKIMGLLMVGQEEGFVRVVQAAIHIGEAIEQEFKIQAYLETRKKSRKKNGENDKNAISRKDRDVLGKRVMKLIKMKKLMEVQKLIRNEILMEPWGRDSQAKLGSRLIELLIESAFVQVAPDQLEDTPPQIQPAFNHTCRTISKGNGKSVNRFGVIECDPLVHKGLDSTARHMIIPYLPMLIPPKSWKGYDKGGHLFLPSYVMRTHGAKEQQDAIRSVPRKQIRRVFEALDTLGSTKWRINRRILDVVECLWSKGGGIAGLVERQDVPLPEKPESEDPEEIQKWKWNCRKAKKANSEMHAQRCDIELKLSVARNMREEEEFYYPHNLDFRGRAYPMHSHLNHLSSDLCRGTLEFAEGKPLGESGLRWLKIHLANKYGGGVNKLSHDGRLAFVDDHLNDIFDSAENPVDGKRWWINAEDPFQCLAACIDLCNALKSSYPTDSISNLPIHQDGSCNGLQHYAALGRDGLEAAAVNLVAREKPADVYSEIANGVMNIMRKDAGKDAANYPTASFANMLADQVDRKLVKQTVMTSVYGVTYVGAREQIKRRLEEKGLIKDDRVLFGASCYSAKVTLDALGEMFQAARSIMKWLGDCAKIIASVNQPVRWVTPLGLPVVQPYRNSERHLIRTSLQVLALQREGQSVSVKRQKTAFPPNFVHSLDGSHMMMTAISCKNAGLTFAGVHDSFWTHARDVDQMNRILREQFVELYNNPILENLLESFERSYPTLVFPPLPARGNFDLKNVLQSPYFFN